ncbi:hypothetical protein WJ39_13890 [Burkholderia diffusa]|nr:hypothetical protein WJ39_13890 [Burkholderia diffusa]
MPSLRQTALVQLRRYQRVVTYGAGAVITVLLLVAFALVAVSMLRSALLGQQQDFEVDRSLVMSEIDAREAMLRHVVVSAQLVWRNGPAEVGRPVDRFQENGDGTMSFPAWLRAPGIAYVSRAPDVDTGALTRYLALAAQMAYLNATSSRLRGEIQTGYYYSTRRDFAALIAAPVPIDERAQEMLADRDGLMRALDTGLERASAASTRLQPNDLRVEWLPLAPHPLTGRHIVRTAAVARDGDEPFAVFVGEHDPQRLLRPLIDDHFGGTFLIVANDRSLVASGARDPVARELVERVRHSSEITLPDHRRRAIHRNDIPGIFTISDRLGDTGWTLVYAFSWVEVLRAVRINLIVAGVATLVLIAVLWGVVALLNRRKFAPAYERSQRVFDSEQLSRTLIATAPVGLGLIDPAQARLLLASPMMEEMAARAVLADGSLASALVRLHRTGSDPAEPSAAAHAVLSMSTTVGVSVDLAVSTVPARYQGQTVLVAAFADVTAQKQIERQLRVAKAAADDANAAKSAFLAAMSHEIRTPLNAFLGNLELLSHTSLDAKQRDRLATIRAASESLLSIIRDVLDFSKIEAGEMAFEQLVFPVLDVIDRSVAVFAPAARAKGLTMCVRVQCSADQPMRGDPTRLGQILNNLLDNAIKFTARGAITIDVAVAASFLKLSVRDTGIGIAPERRAALFQPFVQADRSINRRFGGTGLGLALCQRLTAAMGGTIDIDGGPGAGSRFTVRLPIGAAVTAADRRFDAGHGPAILVSADAKCRAGWRRHLREWGLDVLAYSAPADVDESSLRLAGVVVLHGAAGAAEWPVDDENRLVEAGKPVVLARGDGPWQPVCAGRIVEVTCDSIRALRHALQQALIDEGGRRPFGGFERPALGRSLAVLVVDDNPVNRALLAEQLALLGCDAGVAANGDDAISALATRQWDVLLTDLDMPDISGHSLASRVREWRPTLPIVAVTAQATPEDHARCASAGIARVVTKPLSLAGLRTVLLGVTAGIGTPVTGEDEDASSLLAGRVLPAPLVTLFRETSEASLAALRDAMRAGATDRVLAELHSLKGMLGVFRTGALAHRCAALEASLTGDGFDESRFDALAAGLRALITIE